MNEMRRTFDEIEVRSIRIVDDTGTLRLSVSGKPVPDALFRGEPLIKQERQAAGFIFFTEEGTECGGLIFSGSTRKQPGASAHFSFDQYEQDQVMWISYGRRGEQQGYGIHWSERPLYPISQLVDLVRGWRKWLLLVRRRKLRELKASAPQRLLMGRKSSGEVGLFMHDSTGKERARIFVDGDDEPRIEFLDEAGRVTRRLPPDE